MSTPKVGDLAMATFGCCPSCWRDNVGIVFRVEHICPIRPGPKGGAICGACDNIVPGGFLTLMPSRDPNDPIVHYPLHWCTKIEPPEGWVEDYFSDEALRERYIT